jgi:organic hydroperoxide reductase OsmC/OhrA
MKEHRYEVTMTWTGNLGEGTSTYRGYSRNHTIEAPGKPAIPASSDPHFRGDASRYNPEEMLVASLSACHMLWYLHLCADSKIVVTAYSDTPTGLMVETGDGGGRFREVVLRPRVSLKKGSDPNLARRLHERANELCFIANSMNFAVRHEPQILVETA